MKIILDLKLIFQTNAQGHNAIGKSLVAFYEFDKDKNYRRHELSDFGGIYII